MRRSSKITCRPIARRPMSPWDIYPEGLRAILKDDVAPFKLPVVITENGIADRDDKNRMRFLMEHLYQLGWAMQDGVDVRGYFHWSLMDNFEWQNGFCPNFGFASLDHSQSAFRTLRPSGSEYKKHRRFSSDSRQRHRQRSEISSHLVLRMSHSIDPKPPSSSLRPPGWAEMDTGNVTPHPSMGAARSPR